MSSEARGGWTRCPECHRPWPEHAPTTVVVCGDCGHEHELTGSKGTLAGSCFPCEDCGALNVVPDPGGEDD